MHHLSKNKLMQLSVLLLALALINLGVAPIIAYANEVLDDTIAVELPMPPQSTPVFVPVFEDEAPQPPAPGPAFTPIFFEEYDEYEEFDEYEAYEEHEENAAGEAFEVVIVDAAGEAFDAVVVVMVEEAAATAPQATASAVNPPTSDNHSLLGMMVTAIGLFASCAAALFVLLKKRKGCF